MYRRRNIVSMSLMTCLICGLLAGVLSGAGAQDSHPHYLHALSDLRMARGLVIAGGDGNVKGQEREAFKRIEKAISEIKRAAIDDGKSLEDHPPVDVKLKHRGRLRKVMSLLESVRRDLMTEEDNRAALGWRRAALKHVEEATKATRHAIDDIRNEE